MVWRLARRYEFFYINISVHHIFMFVSAKRVFKTRAKLQLFRCDATKLDEVHLLIVLYNNR